MHIGIMLQLASSLSPPPPLPLFPKSPSPTLRQGFLVICPDAGTRATALGMVDDVTCHSTGLAVLLPHGHLEMSDAAQDGLHFRANAPSAF